MKRILCYGDSNTWGFVPGSFDWETLKFERYDESTRWTGVLANQLGDQYKIIEEGLNGRTSAFDDPANSAVILNGKSYLLPCLLSQRPLDAIVIMLGTNDLKTYFNLPPSSIAFGIRQLIWTIRSILPKTETDILIVSPPIAREGYAVWNGLLDESAITKSIQFAAEFEKVAQYENCHFLDAAKIAEFSAEDGIHLDEAGHQLLGNAVSVALTQILLK